MQLDEKYWTDRYHSGQTQWDAGAVTTPLKEYFDQLTDKSISILIPGCGNAWEAEYLHGLGFSNVFLVDISHLPLNEFARRCPGFPSGHLLHRDFFLLEQKFDMIVEQTFFCSLDPSQRKTYAEKCADLLNEGGKLVGLLFNDQLNKDHPPYGGSKEEYLQYFKPMYNVNVFEMCYNSIKPREGRELFIHLTPQKKSGIRE